MWSFNRKSVRHCSLFTSSPTCTAPGHAPVTPLRAGTDLHVAPPNLLCIISTKILVAAPSTQHPTPAIRHDMTQRSYHLYCCSRYTIFPVSVLIRFFYTRTRALRLWCFFCSTTRDSYSYFLYVLILLFFYLSSTASFLYSLYLRSMFCIIIFIRLR